MSDPGRFLWMRYDKVADRCCVRPHRRNGTWHIITQQYTADGYEPSDWFAQKSKAGKHALFETPSPHDTVRTIELPAGYIPCDKHPVCTNCRYWTSTAPNSTEGVTCASVSFADE